MAGKLGQGKTQKSILAALDTNPILSLSSLNPDGNRSRRKAIRKSAGKLLAAGLLERMKVVVPTPSGPMIYDAVAKAGAVVLGIPTVSQNDIVQPVQKTQEPEAEKETLSLDERIQRLQKRINS
jgi:hypothetical protein